MNSKYIDWMNEWITKSVSINEPTSSMFYGSCDTTRTKMQEVDVRHHKFRGWRPFFLVYVRSLNSGFMQLDVTDWTFCFEIIGYYPLLAKTLWTQLYFSIHVLHMRAFYHQNNNFARFSFSLFQDIARLNTHTIPKKEMHGGSQALRFYAVSSRRSFPSGSRIWISMNAILYSISTHTPYTNTNQPFCPRQKYPEPTLPPMHPPKAAPLCSRM